MLIRAESLRRSFGVGAARFDAVSGVSFEIKRQEVVLLFGPSGSGKSTLLGLVGGLDRQYTGSLSLFGHELKGLSDAALSQLRGERIGFVFQSFHLLEHLSVLDNVAAPALFARPRLTDAEERAQSALVRVGLGDRARARPSELSGGQRQRVAIARALLRKPDLLLCDEPTGNLDRKTGESVVDLFHELHTELGTTLVIVTHEHRLDRIATRTLHLSDGALVKEIEHSRESRAAAALALSQAKALESEASDETEGSSSSLPGSVRQTEQPVQAEAVGEPEEP